MNQFVLIFSIGLENPTEQENIVQVMSHFREIIEWSCDLDDLDKILRVVCYRNIHEELRSNLEGAGISAFVQAVFKKTKAGPKIINNINYYIL